MALTETLTIASNELLGVDPVLKTIAALAIIFLSFALVGLVTGLGARYPRFDADATQVAGSYGGVAFMIQAVLFIIVMIALVGWPSSLYLFQRARGLGFTLVQRCLKCGCFVAAAGTSLIIWWWSMRAGVNALEKMRG